MAVGRLSKLSFQLTNKWAKINGISYGLPPAQRRRETILAIRGVDNAKTFSALPSDLLPQVQWDVPVAIIFLEEVSLEEEKRQHQVEVARRMRAAGDAMPPLGMSVKELIEAGRER